MTDIEQEISSHKYYAPFTLLPLSNGEFALLGHHSNFTGLPVVAVGSWESLRSFVEYSDDLFEHRYEQAIDPTIIDKAKAMLAKLGLVKPKAEFVRRI